MTEATTSAIGWPEYGNLFAETFCQLSIQARPKPNFSVDARSRVDGGFGVSRFRTVAGRARLERTDAIPKTSVGKTDKKRLRAQYT